MKIALIRREFRPHRGGAERYGHMFAAGLVAAGHEVHLYASRVDETLPQGVVHHPVPSLELWSPLRRLSFDRAAKRRVARERFDIVQALEPYTPCDVYQAGDGLHRFWLSLPEARSSWLTPQHPVKLWIERQAFRPDRKTRITVPSTMVKRQATRLYRVPAGRIDVIEPPIDVERFASIGPVDAGARRERLGIGPDDVACCFVGLNYRRKGLPTLLEALARLDRRFHLLVVGRDRRSWIFRWRVHRMGLADRVHFLGTTGAVESVLAWSDALVLPALYDPFGLVVAEAMAAGRPVVASRGAGAAEWIRHGHSGLVQQDPRDAGELASLLGQLADPGLREKLGRNAAETLRGQSVQEHMRRILAVYDRVLEGRAGQDAPQPRALPLRRTGSVEAEQGFADVLERADVLDFDAVAALPIERELHAVRPERRTDLVRVGDSPVVRKLYRDDPRGAAREWRALVALAREGLSGPPPLALAASTRGSAVLMGYVEGEAQLDHWARERLASLPADARRRTRRAVIDLLADRVRELHRRGFTHRDLYLCHVWVREDDGLRLRFMDLHRVERRTPPPRRRVVKDLAALHFSASRLLPLSRADALRFFKRYLDVPALAAPQRRLARAVLRKSARIEHHNRGREV